MSKTKKILGANILIFLIYTLMLSLRNEIFIAGIVCLLQTIACLIIASIYLRKLDQEIGKAFLLSSGVLFLISITVCSQLSF